MNRPLRWSWWSGLSPVGVRSGLAMYSRGLAASVAAQGVEVRGVGLGAPSTSGPVEWFGVAAEPRSRLRALASTNPYIANRLAVDAHITALEAELKRNPDVVVLDHLMSGWALELATAWRRSTGGIIVHVAHNDEAAVRTRWAAETPWSSPRGWYLRFDGARSARLQAKVIEAADLVTVITEADQASIAARHHSVPTVVLMPGHPAADLEPSTDRPALESRPRSVVLLGTLDWEAKRQNVLEVVSAVDSRLADAGVSLRVVGGGDDAFVAAQHGQWRATTFTGAVDDLGAELSQNRVGLVAEPIGGGFKLKSLDYVFAGLPMVVLDGSMEGLGVTSGVDHGASASVGELADVLIDAVNDVESLERWAASALSAVSGRFSWSDRGESLVDRVICLRAER